MKHRKNVPIPAQNQHSKTLKTLKKKVHLTHRMKRQNDVPVPARNQHCEVEKRLKKQFKILHLTHDLTHQMTHHLRCKSVYVSLLVAEMAVKANMSLTLHKNSFSRFFPLSTSLIKAFQKCVYKMADLIGMAHSLNLKSITF